MTYMADFTINQFLSSTLSIALYGTCLFCRIPTEPLSKSGLIRQRQRCVESQKTGGEDAPTLNLVPCSSLKGVPEKSQVLSTIFI